MTTALSTKPGAYVRELWRRRDFAYYMAIGRLKAQNASTTLGMLWWVLNPTLLALIFLLVFGVIYGARDSTPNYLAFLLSGLFPYYYTRNALTSGTSAILGNAKLMANLKFPRLLLPISTMIEEAIGFLASLVAYVLIAGIFDGVFPGLALAWMIPTLLIHTLFNFGVTTFVARLAVPFRDINNLVPYGLRLWLYLSPIVYTIDQAPELLRRFLYLNPLTPILDLWRTALLGEPLDWTMLLLGAAWAIGISAIGAVSFVRSEHNMVRYL